MPRLEDYESRVAPKPEKEQQEENLDRDLPKVCVITVCRNAADTIENTINSVIRQTYKNLDYIIVDGASSDGTIDIIKRYESRLASWISEPDRGIYDAMNKGIALTEGDDSYVIFIGADDAIACDTAIEKFLQESRNEDFLYGNVSLTAGDFSVTVGHQLDAAELAFNMAPHQATFVKKRLFRKLGLFNLNYKISADFDFAIRAFNSHASVRYIDRVVTAMGMEGTSSVNFKDGLKEKLEIISTHYSRSTLIAAAVRIHLYEIPRNTLAQCLAHTPPFRFWRNLKVRYAGLRQLVL